MNKTTYPHIEFRSDGAAIVSGTTTKVIEIVLDHLAHHWQADEIHEQYPYLSLAQIHAALTFYYDNQQELDKDIDNRRRKALDIQAKYGDSKIRDKLRRLGHLP